MRPWNEGGLYYLKQPRQSRLRPFLWRANNIEVEYTTKNNLEKQGLGLRSLSKFFGGLLEVIWLIIHHGAVGEPNSSNRML